MGSLYKSTAQDESEVVGLLMALALLAECLDKKGVLKFEEYRDCLMRSLNELPADDVSPAGAAINFLIGQLNGAIDKKAAQGKASTG